MIIETSDFILEQTSESSLLWDLTFSKIVNKGKENERIEFKDPLYGVSIESAKKRIALWRINKLVDKKLAPNDFNTLYKQEKEKIDKELTNI